ncbi:Antho-RFamide neuropeptides-like [Homarus americanus]|uniref:Antho-RFamide neuropeptides-like n=2 Tax=Homarus americanus TaxID=6706 RepID=A0A8J5MKE6_HOMAM|nr:Antho-RFamide neuropeptides-like [Homarus americanus]
MLCRAWSSRRKCGATPLLHAVALAAATIVTDFNAERHKITRRMGYKVLLLLCLLAYAWAEDMTEAPLEDLETAADTTDTENSTVVPILRHINEVNEDGSYTFGFEAADGTFKIETRDNLGNVKGKYGYTDDFGDLKVVEYTAGNATGFEVKSDLLPKVVLPPPINAQQLPGLPPRPRRPQFNPQRIPQSQQFAPQPHFTQPQRPQFQPQPGQFAPQPQSGQFAPQPQPGRFAPQPQPGRFAPQPQPGRFAPQPQPGRFAPQPQPGRFAPQPQPQPQINFHSQPQSQFAPQSEARPQFARRLQPQPLPRPQPVNQPRPQFDAQPQIPLNTQRKFTPPRFRPQPQAPQVTERPINVALDGFSEDNNQDGFVDGSPEEAQKGNPVAPPAALPAGTFTLPQNPQPRPQFAPQKPRPQLFPQQPQFAPQQPQFAPQQPQFAPPQQQFFPQQVPQGFNRFSPQQPQFAPQQLTRQQIQQQQFLASHQGLNPQQSARPQFFGGQQGVPQFFPQQQLTPQQLQDARFDAQQFVPQQFQGQRFGSPQQFSQSITQQSVALPTPVPKPAAPQPTPNSAKA